MRDPVLVAMIWVAATGFAGGLLGFTAAVSARRLRWHWLDLLLVPALIVGLWLGVHLFSPGGWIALAALLAVHATLGWLGSAQARERVYSNVVLWRSRSRLAAAIFLGLVAIFSLV